LRERPGVRIRQSANAGRTMKKLSLSQAWDETRMVLARDGKLFASVALGLVVLPQTIIGLFVPRTTAEPTPIVFALLLISLVVGFIAQIALNRLAIGPSTTVGSAIGRGVVRMPVLIASFILITLVLFVLLVVFALLLGAVGVISSPTAGQGPPASVLLLIILFAAVTYAIFQLTIPVAAAEHGGPIHLLTRSWTLARGNYLRLLGFVVLVLVGLVFVLMAGQFGLGSMIAATLGPPQAGNVSALMIALVVALIQAAFTVVFAVMLARIYLQLAGTDAAHASVPKSGT